MAARKPSERRHGAEEESPELNLVPIMAIMVILIPMLIYMFNFSEIKVQRVMAPRRGTGAQKTKEEKKEKPLNLTIKIQGDKGFALQWEEALMTDNRRAPLIPMRQASNEFCPNPEEPGTGSQGCIMRSDGCFCYDFAGLYTELVRLKLKFSKPEKPERRVNLTALDDVPWAVVSRTMDAANCMLEAEAYDTLKAYSEAKPKMAG